MVSKSAVIKLLPPYLGKKRLVNYQQSTNDIIDEILITHDDCLEDYDRIYSLFDQGSDYQTSKQIWDFLKYNLEYRVESDAEQTVKTPAAILNPHEKTDCKHYSLFAGGVLDAINRNEGDEIDWCYRFASYNKSKMVQHVFVVVKEGGREYWIDPVLRSFNEHKQPTFFIDKKPMALFSVSGIGDTGKSITVDKASAESGFLKLVNMDIFSLKQLLKNNMDIVYTDVQDYYNQNGLDFNLLLKFLQ